VAELRAICVFCGSSPGLRAEYAEAARALGSLLARRGITLVYGGSDVGLMKIVADACLEAGGQVIGVIPRTLVDREIAHRGLTKLHVVESMHERKALMADLSDAFIALPGGFGTFDEFFEILTWAHLGLHAKPCALVNTAGYFDLLLAMADHAVAEGMLRPSARAAMLCASSGQEVVDLLSRLVGIA